MLKIEFICNKKMAEPNYLEKLPSDLDERIARYCHSDIFEYQIFFGKDTLKHNNRRGCLVINTLYNCIVQNFYVTLFDDNHTEGVRVLTNDEFLYLMPSLIIGNGKSVSGLCIKKTVANVNQFIVDLKMLMHKDNTTSVVRSSKWPKVMTLLSSDV